jgi:hypothetical protein
MAVTVTSPIFLAKILRCISIRPSRDSLRVFLTRLAANVFLAAFGSLSVVEGLPIARYERLKVNRIRVGAVAYSGGMEMVLCVILPRIHGRGATGRC